jgi:hypothetical protein
MNKSPKGARESDNGWPHMAPYWPKTRTSGAKDWIDFWSPGCSRQGYPGGSIGWPGITRLWKHERVPQAFHKKRVKGVSN